MGDGDTEGVGEPRYFCPGTPYYLSPEVCQAWCLVGHDLDVGLDGVRMKFLGIMFPNTSPW